VIARRFDERYGRANPATPVFPQAEALLSSGSLILGLDGSQDEQVEGQHHRAADDRR
jgi:tryptophanyl-tRNA synthetase